MGLCDIIIKRTVVDLGDGQNFSVRGLSAMDVMALIHTHGKALALAFGKIKSESAGRTMTPESVRDLLVSVGSDVPDLLAAIIALASDSYNDKGISVAMQLPFLNQVSAAQAIFNLSFTSETEVKKLVESLATGAVTMATALKTPTMTSLDGISESDAA